MDGARILALASAIGALMVGGLYAAASELEPGTARADDSVLLAEPMAPRSTVSTAPLPAAPAAGAGLADPPATDAPPDDDAVAATDTAIPVGRDAPPELVALLEAGEGAILDAATGVVVGPLRVIGAAVEPAPESEPTLDGEADEASDETTVAEVASEAPATRPRRAARATPPRPPIPRLHPDPGRHVIAVARRMMAQRETVQGSCYRYLSEVFSRAGHEGWRDRRVVYREGRNGPYANLDLIRPGDWLYIVNHPERTPVGTHSVLFVSWSDRGRGVANVIEHSGWGAPSAGRERTYEVTRTYRIVRPILR